MKIEHLEHKHGGRITNLSAIEHGTGEHGAWWEFVGRVEWSDGGVSEEAHISPVCLCYDHDNASAKAECDTAMEQLNTYLARNGKWDEHANGWKPKAKSGREALA